MYIRFILKKNPTLPRGESGMIRSRDRRPPIRAISSTNGVKRQRQIAEASSSIRARTVIGRLSLLLRSHYAASFRPITPKRPAQPRVTRGKNWSLLEQLGGKNKVERGRRWKNSTRSSMEQNVNAIFHRGSETVARRRETTGWLARRIDFPTYHATRYPPYSFRCFRHVWSLFFLFFFPLLFLLSAFEEPHRTPMQTDWPPGARDINAASWMSVALYLGENGTPGGQEWPASRGAKN